MPISASSLQDAAESVGQSLPERDLAEATRLHRNTITNIETGKYAGDETSLAVIEAVLKRAGVEFVDENGGGAGGPPAKAKVLRNRGLA